MYINGKLADSALLSVHKISNGEERELYIQGAVNDLLEKWSALLEDGNLSARLYIKGQFDFW